MSEKYDVAVIGSGSGGSEAALLAADKGFRAILIEKDAFGGTRFHRGCYAVRALHASSRVYRQIVKSRQFGIETDLLRNSLVDWMKAQRAASARLAEDLRTGLEQLNARIAAGAGSLVGEHQVRITDSLGNHEDIEAEYIILATGSRPDYSSSQGSRFFNSDDLIARVLPPHHLFIIGGGYVGCEFASIYRALGCRVSLAEQQERLLPGWDPNVGERVAAELSANGVELYLGRKVEPEKAPIEDGYPILTLPDGEEISPDLVLVATGRRPNVESIGLDRLGIAADPYVKVDAQLRTSQRHIFAIGDVNGLNMLDSSASAQARIAFEAIRGERAALEIFGNKYPTPDGTCVRDYIHVNDLAEAHVQGLEYLNSGGISMALNLGTGRGHSVREVLSAIKTVTGHEVPSRMASARPGDPPELVADPTCAEHVLHWKAKRSLEEIVATAWKWAERAAPQKQ